LKEWPGGDRATLALVFTDILASTALTQELGDEGMRIVREDHFAQGEKFLQQFQGRLIKKIGDSLMVAFKSVDKALDFSRRFHSNPGHPRVQIRAGIHVGSMDVTESDVDGHNVNLAARVAHAIQGAEIWLSNEAMSDLNHLKPERFRHLTSTPIKKPPKANISKKQSA
jgi:class 3 adenylate cyclase